MRPLLLFIVAYFLTTVLTPIATVIKSGYIVWRYGVDGLKDYFFVAAVGFDQAGGSILYSQENYTISSYTYYLCTKVNKNYCSVMKMIDFIFGSEHCKNSYYWEIDKDFKDIEKCSERLPNTESQSVMK